MAASSYDDIFQRTGTTFALTQRVRHNWHKFKGTIKVAIQSLASNIVLEVLPPPPHFLMRAFYTVYLILLILLAILLVKQLYDKNRWRQNEDFDLVSAARSRETIDEISHDEFSKMMIFVLGVFCFIFLLKYEPFFWYWTRANLRLELFNWEMDYRQLSPGMSSANDSSIFQRNIEGFALSQRSKHIWHEFRGTVRVAIQTFSINTILQLLPPPPHPLVLVIFAIYLYLLLFLGVLLVWRRFDKNCRLNEDIDLFSIAKKQTTSKLRPEEFYMMVIFILGLYFFIVIYNHRSLY